jgi:hypothetical protein
MYLTESWSIMITMKRIVLGLVALIASAMLAAPASAGTLDITQPNLGLGPGIVTTVSVGSPQPPVIQIGQPNLGLGAGVVTTVSTGSPQPALVDIHAPNLGLGHRGWTGFAKHWHVRGFRR